jgi:Domain of unknown function (DUF4386)
MKRATNARIAGFTFLFYIAAGITSMVLFRQSAGGTGVAAKLAGIAQHATYVRFTVLLTLLQGFSALVLAVTLYAITRDEDPDLAMLGLTCRVAEGVTGIFVARTLGLLWLATAAAPTAEETGAAHVLGAFLLRMGSWNPGATFFAVGSTIFSWLLLRGRMIPAALAWLGVFASVLLVVILPLELAGLVGGPVTTYMWLPALVFELALALWLLVKGAAPPARMQPA